MTVSTEGAIYAACTDVNISRCDYNALRIVGDEKKPKIKRIERISGGSDYRAIQVRPSESGLYFVYQDFYRSKIFKLGDDLNVELKDAAKLTKPWTIRYIDEKTVFFTHSNAANESQEEVWMLAKASLDGTKKWEVPIGGNSSFLQDLSLACDSGLLVTVATNGNEELNTKHRLEFAKFSFDGKELWSAEVPFDVGTVSFCRESPSQDGGLVALLEDKSRWDEPARKRIVKIDGSGNINYAVEIEALFELEYEDLVEMPDGTVYIAGRRNNQSVLGRLEGDGATYSEELFVLPGSDDAFLDKLVSSSDGALYVAGPVNEADDVFFAKLSLP